MVTVKKYQTETKPMQACTKTHHFKIKNAKIFWVGDTPSPDATPLGDLPAAYGAQAQRDTTRKKS